MRRTLASGLAALTLAAAGAGVAAALSTTALARDGGCSGTYGTSGHEGPGGGGGPGPGRDGRCAAVVDAAPPAAVRAPAAAVPTAPPPPAPATAVPGGGPAPAARDHATAPAPAPTEKVSTERLAPALGIAGTAVAILSLVLAGFRARRRLAIGL
jgi:hypothetical protein